MRRNLLSLVLLSIILATFTPPAQAGIPIIWSNGGESMMKVADLPDSEEYITSEGKFYDIGYRYKQFKLFWIPVWNYDKQWCGYIDNDTFVNLTETEVFNLAQAAGVRLPKNVQPPFWDEWGGKLLLLSGLGLLIFIKSAAQQETNDPEEQDQVDKA